MICSLSLIDYENCSLFDNYMIKPAEILTLGLNEISLMTDLQTRNMVRSDTFRWSHCGHIKMRKSEDNITRFSLLITPINRFLADVFQIRLAYLEYDLKYSNNFLENKNTSIWLPISTNCAAISLQPDAFASVDKFLSDSQFRLGECAYSGAGDAWVIGWLVTRPTRFPASFAYSPTHFKFTSKIRVYCSFKTV